MELTAPVSHISCLGVALNAVLSLSLTGQVAAHALEATAVKRGSFGQTGEAPPRNAAGWSCKAVHHGLALLFGGGEFVVHVLKTTKIQVTVVANEPKVVCRVDDAPDSDFLKEESCEVEVPPMIKGVVLRSKGRPKRVVKPELLTLEPRQTTMESHTDLLLVPFIRLPGTTFSHEVHWNNAVAMFPSSTIREMPPGEVDIVVMTDGSEHWWVQARVAYVRGGTPGSQATRPLKDWQKNQFSKGG